jgi:hypothetical protein
VYLEIQDENTNSLGQGPANTQYPLIDNPYYDLLGNAYTTAYPNSFSNMKDTMVNALGYANKGALPDWMTSKQTNGKVLGFTRAVVLAYTVPNASEKIAYRLRETEFDFNSIDFTVDRYQLDNNYSANYDITSNAFITSTETTFDRYPGLSTAFNNAGTVNYAISIAFDSINQHTVSEIQDLGGMDGVTDFQDGDKIVFAQQEYRLSQADIGDYNQGWSNVQAIWDQVGWDYDNSTTTTADDQGWDQANYIPGSREYAITSDVNQRIGVWQINIDADNFVTLTFVEAIHYYDKLFVLNGRTYGQTNIYYDPVVKHGLTIPNYSLIPQQINVVATRFDGNGTRFYNYRDQYTLPEAGDKYIKFTKTGVFT